MNHSNCLLIAATAFEIEPWLKSIRREGKDPNPDVLITGVGLMATTYALARQVRLKRPRLVIQGGLAGCLDEQVALGSVFNVSSDRVADEMVIESGKLSTVYDLGLRDPDQSPYKKGWLVNQSQEQKLVRLPKARSITVNQVTTGKKLIELYRQKYSPTLETMEGAALHFVCLNEKIPFLQVRSVSNYTGERNKKKWKLNNAIDNLNQTLKTLFDKL